MGIRKSTWGGARNGKPVVFGLMLATLSTACATQPMRFTADDRVEITSPDELSVVSQPMTLSWSTSGLAPDQQFAVFVDRRPLRPGQHLKTLADETCKRTPGCPDAAYLQHLGVYVTSSTSVRVAALPVSGLSKSREDRHAHRAIVVLLDDSDRRRGESAWSVTFRTAA